MAAPSPGRRLLRRPLVRTTLAAGLLAASIVPLGAAPAAADHDAPCLESEVPGSERLADTHAKDNPAFERMHVEQAQELATGRGVKVAVIDSGMVGIEGLDVAGGLAIEGVNPSTRLSGHGTIVAGLIAGPRGVAPGRPGLRRQGLRRRRRRHHAGRAGAVVGRHRRGHRRRHPRRNRSSSSTSSTSPSPSASSDPELEAAVARLVDLGVVVVAAAGNVPVGTPDSGFAGTPDNDADVFPADYPGVLAVSATPPGDESPSAYVVPNLDTDVAAPTLGAISANATGQVCVVDQVATSWASAEVSGVMALLKRALPARDPAAAGGAAPGDDRGRGRPRGTRTARRRTRGPVRVWSRRTTRSPGRSGRAARARWRPPSQEVRADAQAPPAPERIDLFGTPRAILLWSGLVAGSLLALAFMLRPLLRR